MLRRNAPSGRHAAGALVPSTRMLTTPFPTSSAMLSFVLFPLLTPTLGTGALLCHPPPYVTSWSWLVLIMTMTSISGRLRVMW